ncbi:MAG TPA: DUF881 domain-containing protein [bacterium]|jgi:uncharacterized protein YlxW (UPF0749 family)|nr:DUF881 domain-containing protein [bacterium]
MRRQGQIWITIICIVLGVILTAQLRTQAGIRQDIPTKRIEEMASLLKEAELERDALRSQLYELQIQTDEITSQEKSITAGIRKDLQQAKMIAGLTEVQGPGLLIILNDSTRAAQSGQDPNLFLIHDEDLLKLVNELKASGAEAITVNGQRVIAATEIRCAGPTISVNNTRISPPYAVEAIGDPAALESALKMRGGIIETMQFWGIQVQIEKKEQLLLPAYLGSHTFKYTRPVDKREAQ